MVGEAEVRCLDRVIAVLSGPDRPAGGDGTRCLTGAACRSTAERKSEKRQNVPRGDRSPGGGGDIGDAGDGGRVTRDVLTHRVTALVERTDSRGAHAAFEDGDPVTGGGARRGGGGQDTDGAHHKDGDQQRSKCPPVHCALLTKTRDWEAALAMPEAVRSCQAWGKVHRAQEFLNPQNWQKSMEKSISR